MMISYDIEKIGFGKWFRDQVDPADLDRFDIARVVAVHKDSYLIHNGFKDVFAELVGKLVFSAASPAEYPAVGDYVFATFYDEDAFAIIHQVLPRKSLLKRKTPGKKIDFQLIAANIDVALVVQALDADFNLRRLERYVVMANESNIEPVVLLSKRDLLDADAVANRLSVIHDIMPDLHVQPFSNVTETGLEVVKKMFAPGMTYCMLGSSGVGKTSLLNHLTGDTLFETRAVRQKDGKGRHATTHRHLIFLDCEAMLIDTPGMRELGNFSVETGIDNTFTEIAALAEQCQFNDCTHVLEKGCAVLAAVQCEKVSPERYQNYIKLKKESNHYKMSYLERRQKDRQFGKLIKTVMKHKKNRR